MFEETIVDYPTCGKNVVRDKQGPSRPFCSRRCQLIDLGEWAVEEKHIPSTGDLSDNDDWSEQQPWFIGTLTR